MVVPDDPETYSGQLIYLFPALQGIGPAGTILQPVLQYGNDVTGYWSVAVWYMVPGSPPIVTPHYRVKAGDVLSGWMTLKGKCYQTGDGRFCDYDAGMNISAGVPSPVIHVTVEQAAATFAEADMGALEVYGATGCSDLPASARFYFTSLYMSDSADKATEYDATGTFPWRTFHQSAAVGPCVFGAEGFTQTGVTLTVDPPVASAGVAVPATSPGGLLVGMAALLSVGTIVARKKGRSSCAG